MLNTTTIGNKIAELRKRKNLSQTQLAEQLSISSQAVGKWERGESMPDIITFDRLAVIFGVDLNYFSDNFKTTNESVNTPDDLPKGWNMSASNWKDSDFSGLKNLNDKFNVSNIQNCRFVGSDLSKMTLKGNNVIDCDFSASDMNESRFTGSNIRKSIFQNCDFKKSQFLGSNIMGCDFTGTNFSGTFFKNSTFIKNLTTNVTWHQTELRSTQLNEVIIEGTMSDCSFENCRYSKVEFRNTTLINTFFKGGNLKKIKFTNCKCDNLTYAFLKNGKADLTGIELVSG